MTENIDKIPHEALSFEQQIFFKGKGRAYPCHITRRTVQVSIDDSNTITINPGDALVKKEDTFLKLSHDKISDADIRPISKSDIEVEIRNWVNTYWKGKNITDKDILIEVMTRNRMLFQNPQVAHEINSQPIDLRMNGERKDISEYSIKELMALRDVNIVFWNKLLRANQTNNLTKEQIIIEIRKNYIQMEAKKLRTRIKGIRDRLDELSVIAENNDNPLKIIKDLFSSDQVKLMSASQAKKKIGVLQKELEKVTKSYDILKTLNLEKPNGFDRDVINEVLANYKEQYNRDLKMVIPGIHPKYTQSVKKVASNLEVIESEINFRLKVYVLAQKTDRAQSQELSESNALQRQR